MLVVRVHFRKRRSGFFENFQARAGVEREHGRTCVGLCGGLCRESRVKRGSDKSGTHKSKDGVGLCQEWMEAGWDPDEERQGELAASRGAGVGHGRLWHNDGEYIAVAMR